MDALLSIHAAAGAPVLGVGDTEFFLGMLVLLLALIGVIGRYVYQISLGATKSTDAAASTERTPARMDLGPIRGTFTTYSPWELRIGVSLLVVGFVCGVIGLLGDQFGFKVGAIAALVVGVPILLYVTFKRIDNLELHERGFVLRKGKTKVVAAYYSEVVNCSKVIYETNGLPVLKGVAIDLHDGSNLQIGNDFYKIRKLADDLTGLCDPQEAAAWDAAKATPPSEAVRTQGYSAEELGEEIERFVPGSGSDVEICIGAAAIAGACVLGWSFLPQADPNVDRGAVLCFIGGALFIGIVLILLGLGGRRVRLALCRNGLHYCSGWYSYTVRYADIRRTSVVTTNDRPSSVALTLRDNQVLDLSDLKGLDAAAQRLEELRCTPEAAIGKRTCPTA